MSNRKSTGIVDMAIGWVRKFFSQGAGQLDRAGTKPGDGRRELPDLDATDSDYEYTGRTPENSTMPEEAGSGGPASRAADEIEQARSERTDLDESSGTATADGAPLPPDSAADDEAFRLHDAVGGHDATAGEDVDAPIDTSRDSSQGTDQPEAALELDDAARDLDDQDQLTAFEGARTDEFTRGGYEPAPVDQEDVEAAAAGEPATMENDTSTSDVGGLRQTADRSSSGPSEQDDDPAGARTDRSGTDSATREEIESAAEGDAFAQGDEAVTAPGQSSPEAFDDDATGTTEPSRSATGNEVEDAPDALGTTLDHSEESNETDPENDANLSAEEELAVTDIGGTTERPSPETNASTSFRNEVDTPETPYANIPDEPGAAPDVDEDLDDVEGSEYPSDRRIDPLAGDDPWDAVEPDIDDPGSSAGATTVPDQTEDVLIAETAPPADTAPAADEVDQDMVAASDDAIGNAPGTMDMATGDADGAALTLEDAPDGEDATREAPDEVENTTSPLDEPGQAAPHDIMDDGGAGTASVQDDDLPGGAVRGDGTTNTPKGYPVKGNASSKIYHLPNFPSYAGTKPEFCFATEQDAINAGYRAPGKRNRGKKK